METRMSLKQWLALIGLTGGAFIFNTSEFVPIGLLTDIAVDFGVTEARAGLLISVYAWMVMLLSLPLMMWVSKMELRRLMLAVVFIFVAFQVLSGVSAGYYMLMFSRIGVACAHAIFWSIVSPMAVRVVPERFRSLALSMILTGTSVAMIVGLPLGRVIGLHIGWRMTFICIAAFSFVLCMYLAFVLPELPSRGGMSVKKLPMLWRNPLLVGFYVLSFAVACAYYTGYSYVEPFLKQVAGMHDSWVTGTLTLFGVMGIGGSIAFSRYYVRYRNRFMTVVLLVLCACLLGLRVSAGAFVAVIVLCACWGMCFTASNVVMQSEIINYSPQEAVSVSMAIFSGLFNLGIGCGTFIGGVVCESFSISYVGYAGGILALLTFVYWQRRVLRLMKCEQELAKIRKNRLEGI